MSKDKKKKDKSEGSKKSKAVKPARKAALTSIRKAPVAPPPVTPAVPTPVIPAAVETAPAAGTPPKAKKILVTRKPVLTDLPAKPLAVERGVEVKISREDIALRAYFIAERRHTFGWPGDEASDWVEAERQIRAKATGKISRPCS